MAARVEAYAPRWGRGREIGVVVLLAALTAATSCARRQREVPAPRWSPARDSLLASDLHRVDTLVARGLHAAMASYLAPDAIYLRPGAPTVYGRENSLGLIATTAPAFGTFTAWQPVGGGVSRDGLSAYTFGVAVHARPGVRFPAVERYIAFWGRVRDGDWRLIAYAEVSPSSEPPTTSIAGAEAPRRVLSRQALGVMQSLISADSAVAEPNSMFGTAASFAGAVADDGVLMDGTELLVGPRDVREYLESRRGTSLSWRPVYAAVAASGDLGFTIGESVVTSRGPSGVAVQRFRKYLTVWRREPDGRWKFVVRGENARPSPVGE
jgi:ketosteroid isomerase-like protein